MPSELQTRPVRYPLCSRSGKEGQFIIADITFKNDNEFTVTNVIVACDLYGDKAKPQDNRGVTIRKVLPSGTTEVTGIEFSIGGTDVPKLDGDGRLAFSQSDAVLA